MGLYFAFLGLTQFVQIPREAAGYGFGATVLEASVVYLLPGAITGFLVALISGRFIDRFGARPVLVVAAAAGITGFLFIALAHSAPWQVIAASILANAYISLGYGALPALVVSEVAAGETGVATSMNAIARTIGSSTAAALVAVLLGRTVGGTSVPMESSFVAIFVGGAVTAALAMVLIALSRVQARRYRYRRGALRIPRHEPRMGLAQRGEVGHRLADLGLQHPGDELSDPGAEQAAFELGQDVEPRPGRMFLHLDGQRDANPAAARAAHFDQLGLVVAGDPPVDDVAESLDLDARRHAGAGFDRRGHLASPTAEDRQPFIEAIAGPTRASRPVAEPDRSSPPRQSSP